MELEGKVAVVTGGAVRVGRALVLALARAGCDVFVHYGRSAGPAEETRDAARALGVSAAIGSADLADPEAAAGVVGRARAALGPVSVLVNSAAIFLEGDLAATDLDAWDRQMAINLRAPFLLTRAFAAELPEGGEGAVVNVLDARIFRPAADHFAYRITKAGLHAMTEGLAHDLAPRIRVNAVALGAILPPPGEDDAHLERLAAERVPLGRPGGPEMVADNAIHLLGQDFLTGVTIRLDGGEFL